MQSFGLAKIKYIKDMEIIKNTHFPVGKYDLIITENYFANLHNKIKINENLINLHYSLLPAFATENPISDAYRYGSKVSGITVHTINENGGVKNIIAQYPILISNLTPFNEFEQEIKDLGFLVYPVVITKILEDKVFDFQDLFKTKNSCAKCNGKCNCH